MLWWLIAKYRSQQTTACCTITHKYSCSSPPLEEAQQKHQAFSGQEDKSSSLQLVSPVSQNAFYQGSCPSCCDYYLFARYSHHWIHDYWTVKSSHYCQMAWRRPLHCPSQNRKQNKPWQVFQEGKNFLPRAEDLSPARLYIGTKCYGEVLVLLAFCLHRKVKTNYLQQW